MKKVISLVLTLCLLMMTAAFSAAETAVRAPGKNNVFVLWYLEATTSFRCCGFV